MYNANGEMDVSQLLTCDAGFCFEIVGFCTTNVANSLACPFPTIAVVNANFNATTYCSTKAPGYYAYQHAKNMITVFVIIEWKVLTTLVWEHFCLIQHHDIVRKIKFVPNCKIDFYFKIIRNVLMTKNDNKKNVTTCKMLSLLSILIK